MITIRKANDRGHANHGWLDSYHTFSFADYYDPKFMGFRSLRVINEDQIAAKRGFGTHSHRDMEIITYVLEGALEHQDSLGNRSVMRPGEVQRMTAGTGVSHSEYNHFDREATHLLQIWILPETQGLKPGYEQKAYSDAEKRGKLCLIASQDGRDGSVKVHQDLNLYATVLGEGEQVNFSVKDDRQIWVQVARGSVMLNGQLLAPGDAAAVSQETLLDLTGKELAEVLVFDLV
ncbi:pirin family protein [Phormidesmis priestleyi ULC007]|uniref:Pirin family protein n=1 Tax=Phormidesmis priestleyi ULC007 TaxID=1920490 RepID=A0A2T1D6X1_9CYAN|nr:pirin family protein [Phormidesmis priestleyi]PSB16187.1 pirin family protein [Phormidesmis priestleyi ULC007]PZO46926.1 MAG: pirin family protein [Phormidesmis priestleyi]